MSLKNSRGDYRKNTALLGILFVAVILLSSCAQSTKQLSNSAIKPSFHESIPFTYKIYYLDLHCNSTELDNAYSLFDEADTAFSRGKWQEAADLYREAAGNFVDNTTCNDNSREYIRKNRNLCMKNVDISLQNLKISVGGK